jgi:hypothetical protein
MASPRDVLAMVVCVHIWTSLPTVSGYTVACVGDNTEFSPLLQVVTSGRG